MFQHRLQWILAATAALAAVLAGVFLPVGAYIGGVALLFLLVVGALVISLQFDRPLLGLGILIATAVAFPVEFRGPAAARVSSSLPLAASLCGVWLVRLVVMRRAMTFERSRVVYSLLIFMGISSLSFVVGQFPLFPSGGAPLPAQIAELSLFLVSGCLFLAVGHQLTSVTQLKTLTWIFVIAGTVTCILQSVPMLAFVARWTTRPGTVGSLFWIWLVAVTTAQALFNRRLGIPVRIALLGVTMLVLGHGLLQVRSWASGWIPPLVALVTILLVRLPRVTIAFGLVALPFAVLLSGYMSSALLSGEEYSLMTRQEAWRVLWQVVERSPFIGTGPANYYYYTENFPLLGWYVRFISHNNYQDLLIQTGFLGLLGFCWFALECGGMTLGLYRRAPAGFARAYAVGALGGLIGSLVAGMLGDWIIPFYYNGGIVGFRSSLLFWVFLGGALALKRIVAKPVAEHAHAGRPSPIQARSSRSLVAAH